MNEKIPHITESALHFLFLRTCGWCKKRTGDKKEVYETDIKIEGMDLKKYEGKVAPLPLSGAPHPVLALVKGEHDLLFHFCGPTCTSSFKNVLPV